MAFTMKEQRERLYKRAEIFRNVLDEFIQLCDYLEEIEECENCPMKLYCLKYESVQDIWDGASVTRLADFLEYADEMESKHTDPMYSQENWDDYAANESRQDFID